VRKAVKFPTYYPLPEKMGRSVYRNDFEKFKKGDVDEGKAR